MTGKPKRPAQGGKIDIERRVLMVDELLAIGMRSGEIERKLAADYNVSVRQARKYIATARKRHAEESARDAPHRRDEIIQVGTRLYQKALAAKDLKTAAQVWTQLAKMSGAFIQRSSERDRVITEIGPPPTDPSQALLYNNRILTWTLWEVFRDDNLDVERRVRLIGDLGAKLGIVQPRTELEAKLARLEAHAAKEVEPVDGEEIPSGSDGSA